VAGSCASNGSDQINNALNTDAIPNPDGRVGDMKFTQAGWRVLADTTTD
jgi:hypothetical protein